MELPPTLQGIIELLSWIGIATGLLITAIKTHRAELGIDKVAADSRRAAAASEQAATELRPNHGSSSKDALARIETKISQIEAKQDHQGEMIKSIGHQIGEITTNAATARHLINSRLDDHSSRLATIEERDNT